MAEEKFLFDYKDDLLKTMIYKPLDTLLLAANKYTTLPIGILQFVVSRINLQPILILTVYDDKSLMSPLSKINDKIDSSLNDISLDSVTPTIIIFPTSFNWQDVIYNCNYMYFYSSTYILDLQRVREGLKNNELTRYSLYTSIVNDERKKVICNLELTNDIGMIKLPNVPPYIKLPFRNIIKYNKLYEGIISSIMGNDIKVHCEENEAEKIYEEVKNNQINNIDGIILFKDFIKQKPLNLDIYSSMDIGSNIRTVCLKMEYKSKFTHIVFYRYIEGLFDYITGSIKEVKITDGE
jgi:hypothetical protein